MKQFYIKSLEDYPSHSKCLIDVNYNNDDYSFNVFTSSCIFNGGPPRVFCLKMSVSHIFLVLFQLGRGAFQSLHQDKRRQ